MFFNIKKEHQIQMFIFFYWSWGGLSGPDRILSSKKTISPVFLPFSGGAPGRLGVSWDWTCLFTHLTYHEARVQEQKGVRS